MRISQPPSPRRLSEGEAGVVPEAAGEVDETGDVASSSGVTEMEFEVDLFREDGAWRPRGRRLPSMSTLPTVGDCPLK